MKNIFLTLLLAITLNTVSAQVTSNAKPVVTNPTEKPILDSVIVAYQVTLSPQQMQLLDNVIAKSNAGHQDVTDLISIINRQLRIIKQPIKKQ